VHVDIGMIKNSRVILFIGSRGANKNNNGKANCYFTY
jgi:hypothetical protein